MLMWFLDSIMLYEFGVRPLMDLDDAKARHPSREDVSRDSLLIRHGNRVFPTITLAEALETLYIENQLPADLSEFSVGLLIHATYRHRNVSRNLDNWPYPRPSSYTESPWRRSLPAHRRLTGTSQHGSYFARCR
ncbi:hypothetical protein BU25DRAFT_241501 [Macroventuria anomochaeta]|uniref:Uncharacterized protein n=1 Tax=Macroventuria anomochaeta TaxID=301207 RepID=A0ACB6RJN1_9PLEO|nr:uncharacterized protein BU25DRAFT_241501 [Macroventuria anomochaeta]KAF2621187.1 hypothetical protein BU25DRAFT_241501 [Macroventuria anomochaeta]